MECQVLRDELMDVLYGEASADTTRRVDEHLTVCAACREEMAGFRSVRRELGEWKLPVMGRQRSVIAPRRSFAWLAAAAGLILATGAALGFSGSEVRYDQGRLAFRLGRGADVEQLLAEQERRHEQEIAELKASLAVLPAAAHDDTALLDKMQALVRESEARQAETFSGSLRELSVKTEAQRRYDLARVSAGLSYLDGKTGQHVARTSELMGYVLQAAEKK